MLVWRPGPQTHLPLPRVNNVVATFCVGTTLDLVGLCLKYRFCEYQPNRFGKSGPSRTPLDSCALTLPPAALTVRCRSPKTTCLAFAR